MLKKIIILILALSFSLKPLKVFVEKNSDKENVRINLTKIQSSAKNLAKNGLEKSSEEQELENEELAFINSCEINFSSAKNRDQYENTNFLSKFFLAVPTLPPSLFL